MVEMRLIYRYGTRNAPSYHALKIRNLRAKSESVTLCFQANFGGAEMLVAYFPARTFVTRFQVQNDYLGLRQPLRITSLAYITSSLASNHLVTGTDIGHIHRYDTRAARRPVFDWKISKTGGVRTIEKGLHEQCVI